MGIIKIIISIVIGAVILLAGTAAVVYVSDTPVQANVTGQNCSLNGANTVDIITEFPVPGIPYTTEVDFKACGAVAALRADGEDPWVQYFIKSEVVEFYDDHPDEGGALIYRG